MEFKECNEVKLEDIAASINRIRLEFKGKSRLIALAEYIGINRIRLEFKGIYAALRVTALKVLIESDWNLKAT